MIACAICAGLVLTSLATEIQAQGRLVYTQLVVGSGFQTILQLTNPSREAWEGSLRVPEFGAGSGVVWMVNDVDLSGLDNHAIELGPWESHEYVLSGGAEQAAVAGSLWIEPQVEPATSLASAFFYRFELDGELVDEVSAPPAEATQRIVFPVSLEPGLRVNTGVAIRLPPDPPANPSQGAAPSTLRAVLLDEAGEIVATAEDLQPGAQFVDEWFSFNPVDNFLGAVLVESDSVFYATALRQRLLAGGRFQITGVDPTATDQPLPAPSTATYRVTFQAAWSAATHPDSFPAGAHFSPLIGGTHRDDVVFWQAGQVASPGIESMAETGATGTLSDEVTGALNAGTADSILRGPGNGSPASVSFEFEISRDFPLVTLVSMIAPSPDWFVGVSALPLFSNGSWRDEVVIELGPWDAGTDSGSTYNSPNQDTQPRLLIAAINGSPFLNQGVVLPLGTFTFTRLEVP